MNRGSLWTSKLGELHDGPSPRYPNALRPNNERQGGLRTIREDPPFEPENEGALQKGLGLRNPNEENGLQSNLPGPGRPPSTRAPQVHGEQGLWLWWAPLCGHGN